MILSGKKLMIGLSILIISFGVYLFADFSNKPQIDKAAVKESSLIQYPSHYNYRQTKNDCGPFNVAAVIRALTGQDADSSLFAVEVGWRLPNDYTLPWGLENQLESKGIIIETPSFNLLSDDEKLLLIQEYLSASKPVVILGEWDGYEHYLSIFGFNADEYYIYDSLQPSLKDEPDMTIDENGSMPGNMTLSSKKLLDFWAGGGIYGFWEWYGLVASGE